MTSASPRLRWATDVTSPHLAWHLITSTYEWAKRTWYHHHISDGLVTSHTYHVWAKWHHLNSDMSSTSHHFRHDPNDITSLPKWAKGHITKIAMGQKDITSTTEMSQDDILPARSPHEPRGITQVPYPRWARSLRWDEPEAWDEMSQRPEMRRALRGPSTRAICCGCA